MTRRYPREQDIRSPAVDRALHLLELLACSNQGLTVSEVSRNLHIPKSSAHYLIYTLAVRGYAQRNLNGRSYSLGPRTSELSSASNAEGQLRAITVPELRRVARSLSLTANATVLNGAEALIIEKADAPGIDEGGQWHGRHVDLHCTAHGKVLIAHLSDVELDALFYDRPLAKFTRNTICSVGCLKEHLSQVRDNGFAINDQEHILGVVGIAAPIFNHLQRVVAAIGVVGTLPRMRRVRWPHIAKEVVRASVEVSRRLLESLPFGLVGALPPAATGSGVR